MLPLVTEDPMLCIHPGASVLSSHRTIGHLARRTGITIGRLVPQRVLPPLHLGVQARRRKLSGIGGVAGIS